MDSILADLRLHSSASSSVAELRSLSPAAHFRKAASGAASLVLVDVATRGDPQKLKSALLSLGMEKPSVFSNNVSGWLPVGQVQAAALRGEVHSISASMWRARTGAVTSQGDFAQHSQALRATYSTLTGTGVTVGAISDSYDCYPTYASNGVPASGPAGYAYNGFTTTASNDVSTGDLPSGVNVLKEADCLQYGAPYQLPFGDEGRAMLQIVHDVAPGAGLAFYTAENGLSDFANGITSLASAAKASVIVDDVGYFNEPFFQDGLLAEAVNQVYAGGVAYFSAAGNDGNTAYDTTAPNFATLSHTAPTTNEYLLNFDNSGATTTSQLTVHVPSLAQGDFVAIVLQWDQPFVTGAANSGGATSQLDLCATGTGSDEIQDLDGDTVSCTGPNSVGSDPVQVLIIANPANAASATAPETINLMVGLAGGTAAPGRLKLAVEGGGLSVTISGNYGSGSTLQGHPGASGAAAVGAAAFYTTPACGISPATLESYSSQGGTPILFDSSGSRLSTPQIRQKPDFVAPDGGNDTFLGFTLGSGEDTSSVAQCANNGRYPNFFGTSAAAPHAAAVAALMLQGNTKLTPSQVYQAMQSTALAMGSGQPDYNAGYGFIQADAALAAVPPGGPSLAFNTASVAPGAAATLTWSSINTTSCSASGSWTGSQATSGTVTVTAPSTAQTLTYTLTCANALGSASTDATLTVSTTAATATTSSSGGGGGGKLDLALLGALSALVLARWSIPAANRSAPGRP